MKATDLLKEQHQEIDELFERISMAESSDMSALRRELAASILGHSTIEKELFYPASREALGASFQLQTAFEEHALVEYALQKLLITDLGDESFHARLSVLKNLVQHHVEEEEHELLKQAEGAMNAQQLEELGARMEARFDEVREGNVEETLAKEVAKSMPVKGSHAPAEKPARKAAAKRSTSKRAPAKRAEPARAAAPAKGRRGATTGRKKPSAPAPAKSGRTAASRKAPARTGASQTRAGSSQTRTGSSQSRTGASQTRAGASQTRAGASKSSRAGRKGGRSSTAPSR